MSSQPVRKVELPDRLQDTLKDPKSAVEEFRKQEEAKQKARIERRVKRFEEKFKDPNSKDHQVLIRQILIADLKAQIAEAKASRKQLSTEIKALRGSKKRNKGTAAATK